MKVLVIYSSLTGNTKKVCEQAFQVLNCEKEIIAIENINDEELEKFENIIIGTWIDKATADDKTRRLLKKLKRKNIYFIGTLAASLTSEHAKKCFNNLKSLCSKNNNFKNGVLARGRVSEDLQEKFNKFPLNIIHKFVPNINEIIQEADPHPNEEDFEIIKKFMSENFC
ncbi:MAG: flavodoxin family protein [Fusobacterium sp.]|uniref:flavodoxin family protein n=1 Tax=Fusobacterium sp. TaxID=68766 RepID=UPI0026DC29C0|nr:flavodoxin family protein [Fusobacterium sp.]MDO4690654.1 flavodoxin family protein [Fusobacterium sp.]